MALNCEQSPRSLAESSAENYKKKGNTMEIQNYMTVKDAAQLLGVSRQTLYVYLNDGAVKGHRLGGTMWIVDLCDLQRIKHERPESGFPRGRKGKEKEL